ncbi:MAG: MerR family transcriptional regulator [Robiginitomaculum sp.]|nr:MerR family transcriptional regulator [Robiginitomaculum sp.]
MHSNLTTDSTPKRPAHQDSWSIADTAEHFDITTRALRFYEDKGLLTPHRANGRRVFNSGDRERLEKILRAKRIGFSLEDIKQFLDITDGDVTDQEELLRRKTSFEAVIKRLRCKRRDIDVIAKDMQDLCTLIDNYLENAPQDGKSGVFEFADAYDAKFRAHLDEDFIPV